MIESIDVTDAFHLIRRSNERINSHIQDSHHYILFHSVARFICVTRADQWDAVTERVLSAV